MPAAQTPNGGCGGGWLRLRSKPRVSVDEIQAWEVGSGRGAEVFHPAHSFRQIRTWTGVSTLTVIIMPACSHPFQQTSIDRGRSLNSTSMLQWMHEHTFSRWLGCWPQANHPIHPNRWYPPCKCRWRRHASRSRKRGPADSRRCPKWSLPQMRIPWSPPRRFDSALWCSHSRTPPWIESRNAADHQIIRIYQWI